MAAILIGESGSGKSSIEKVLEEQFGYNRIISYTTRPIRDGEKDETDYHFVTEDEFAQIELENKFAENTTYRDWHYGIVQDDIEDNSVIVVEMTGFRQLQKIPELNLISFHINVSMRERLIRMLKRGDDIPELIRRSISDQGAFNGIEKEVDFIVDNENQSILDSAKEIYAIVNNDYKNYCVCKDVDRHECQCG